MSRAVGGRSPGLTTTLGVAVLTHGALLLSGSYQRTYDAYVHLFFADHYARDWFSTWETRWYTGFTVTSYPPGTHQMMGLLSKVVGLQSAFMLAQLGAVVMLVLGVHRFSRLWVSDEAANWAALFAVVSTSIGEAIHVFGQLPTTFALGMLLNAMPSIDRWLRDGRRRSLLVGVLTVAATTSGHHVTTLFGSVFFLGPVVARALVDAFRTPLPDEPEGHSARVSARNLWPLVARRLRRVLPFVVRLGLVGPLLIAALVLVVLPYWLWSSSDPILQVPIPHGSRANFLVDRNTGLVFWLIPWGSLVFVLPFVTIRGLAGRTWPLAASVALLTLLGTGGTTPIPRMLLGKAFDILTLDRFTFWATIAVLPMVGRLMASFVDGRVRHLLVGRLGPGMHRLLLFSTGAVVVASFFFAATLNRYRAFQPDPIDPDPIAEFLAKDEHDRWRYLTLGFGDQMAWLGAHTTATTVDGNYHSARRLPELVSRPVERLEGAKFRGVAGVGSLQQFVTTPERYNLKFVFSNDTFYDPLLFSTGWQRLGTLRNGIVVWERADVPPLPAILPTRELPVWQRMMWGLVPMTVTLSAAAAQIWTSRGEPIPALDRRASIFEPAGVRSTRWLSNRLARACAPLAVTTEKDPLQWPLRSRLSSVRRSWERPTSARNRRFASLGVLAVVALGLLTVLIQLDREPASADPSTQIVAYYDDLDFRRFEQAWGRLDPLRRVELGQYLLNLSVEDGLVASYGKLDSVEVGTVRREGDRAVADVSLRYLTSVEAYEVERTHDLTLRDGAWYIDPDPADESIPPSQFVRSTDVEYLDLGRRSQSTENTDANDVLDRPRLEILDSRLVRRDDRWFIVGQVTNVDVDPADITVTGRLLDEAGEALASYNGGQGTVHKVRPGETVPFRVDFEGVAGVSTSPEEPDLDFDPDSVSEIILEDPVASYDLAVRAVVSGRDLHRLAVSGLSLAAGSDAAGDAVTLLAGSLHNGLTVSATIPVLSVAQLDLDGRVMWVDVHYVPDGIRPQRVGSFTLGLTDLSTVTEVEVPFVHYDNGRTDQVDEAFRSSTSVVAPGGEAVEVLVTARAFLRELTP